MYLAVAESAASPILKDGEVLDVAIGIGVIALAVVLLPLWLGSTYNKTAKSTASAPGRRLSFFELPYITWFVVHYGIAIIAILAVVLLGVDNVIDKGTVSALLGSLFGYVLGNANKSGGAGGGGSPFPTKPPTPNASGQPSPDSPASAPAEQLPGPEGHPAVEKASPAQP